MLNVPWGAKLPLVKNCWTRCWQCDGFLSLPTVEIEQTLLCNEWDIASDKGDNQICFLGFWLENLGRWYHAYFRFLTLVFPSLVPVLGIILVPVMLLTPPFSSFLCMPSRRSNLNAIFLKLSQICPPMGIVFPADFYSSISAALLDTFWPCQLL